VTPPLPLDSGGFIDTGGLGVIPADGLSAPIAPAAPADPIGPSGTVLPLEYASVTPTRGTPAMILAVVLALGFLAAVAGLILVGAPTGLVRRRRKARPATPLW
jgi:hypothetical protein